MKNNNIYLVTDFSKKNIQKIINYAKLKIGFIQYRDKNCHDKEFIKNANYIYNLVSLYGVKFIINDRVHLLKKINCDGFHVGQEDGNHAVLRKKYPNYIMGISVNNYQQAKKAIQDGANFLGVGSIFVTNTKQDPIFCSLEELKKMKKFSRKIIIIGGINNLNIVNINPKYYNFVACSSFLLNHENPKKALETLIDSINFNKKICMN